MIKFYYKILNNMLINNLINIIIFLVLIFNILIRIFPTIFINISSYNGSIFYSGVIQPTAIYRYCDVYLLLLFIILIFFYLGVDFNNSMEDISLTVSDSKANKFMLRKLKTLLIVYLILYTLSFINIYTIYLHILSLKCSLIPLKTIVFYSFSTNIFILSLSLFILFLSKDISISTVIITSCYLIEEHLWRCKLLQKYGILGHIYQYDDYKPKELVKIKLLYILLSIVFIFLSYELSKRKRSGFLIKNKDIITK